ncbi:MAG TPA: hypothetical protein VEN79_01350 [Terriglobia bacterium]|nr:hypothetical protein [Terriglobia bacterium]
MPDVTPPSLTPVQVARLESLLKAGFQFVTFEQFARYPGVEKAGFVALLDISGERVRQFGSVGYHLGGGIAVLIERPGGKAFVWKNEFVPATPEILAAYESVKKELDDLLTEGARQ